MGRRGARRARHPPVAGAGRLNAPPPLPFEDSRRLTGPNLYFAEPGAVLEAFGDAAADVATLDAWRARIAQGRDALGWPGGPCVARPHRGGGALAIAAPVDQLFTATELNEWAWQAALGCSLLHAPAHPAAHDDTLALQTLRRSAAAERQPRLRALLAGAEQRGLPWLLDDEQLTLGLGAGGRSWSLDSLPAPEAVSWEALHGIPLALVTGSNGKTTTVRLLVALLQAQGWSTGHSCTDGVIVGGRAAGQGDYSGPAGARLVLRHRGVQAAVLETARGGLLRRGLAVQRADAAIVTNISADHFGEYGIESLADLAAVKLIVARALGPQGLLVLNADDPQLAAAAAGLACPLAWFARDHQHPMLQAHRARGGRTCGIAAGELLLCRGADCLPLGAAATMPLSLDGRADYNLANIAGAVLLADALGVDSERIADVLRRFGSCRADNPGRLERWQFAGLQVLLDYAHNPDGLRGLLAIAEQLRGGGGRLGLLLGQAGNRPDDDIRALADVAAAAAPQRIVLKDMAGFLRGRAPGEVPRLLQQQLLARGQAADSLVWQLDEAAAVRELLDWAQPGDVLLLPVHASAAKAQAASLLDSLEAAGWRAGQALPG